MAPPKCFFKRPEEFYMNGGTIFQPPKLECYSMPSSPIISYNIGDHSSPNDEKTEPIIHNDFFKPSMLQENNPIESFESPLDLSCKFSDSNNNEMLQRLSAYLLQHQTFLPNYLNLERLFLQLPQPLKSSFTQPQPYPKVYVTSPFKSDDSIEDRPEIIEPTHLSTTRVLDHRFYLSPRSASESIRDNSSSETSSQHTCFQQKNKTNKRKIEGKVLRPFKLYKNNDSQGLMEALGINEEDEEWLKSIVEYKSVDDVFLFLTNCMNETTKPIDLTEEVIEKIQNKFGHIFQNCNKSISNPRMIRHPDMTPKELKTEEYWDKRRKNNEAAKRSREARRHKENNLNQHCEKLQSENDCIRKEIERVKMRIEDIKRSIS